MFCVGAQNAQGIGSSVGTNAVSGAIDNNQLEAEIKKKVADINALMTQLQTCSDAVAELVDETGVLYFYHVPKFKLQYISNECSHANQHKKPM